MREIKFRVWDDANKDMDYWGLQDRDYYACSGELRYHIMQYTGLKDKNGVEIYEGDIVRVGNGDIGEVKWDNVHTGFGIVGEKDGPYVVGFMYYGEMKQEIIGNIHESPDLLEEK